MTALFLDGVDATASYGLYLASDEGARDLPSVRLDTLPIPDVAGVSLLALPQIEPRTLSLQGVLKGSSAADVRTKRDALYAVLRRGRVTVRMADAPTRELAVQVISARVASIGAQMLAKTLPIAIELLALDPYWVDVTPQSIAVGTTPTAMPLGTAPSLPVITLATPGAVLAVTLRNALGVVITQLQLAGLTPGVAVTIDSASRTIRQGAISVLSTLIAGDFPVLDAVADGDYAASAWPTIAISQSVGVVQYARRWA